MLIQLLMHSTPVLGSGSGQISCRLVLSCLAALMLAACGSQPSSDQILANDETRPGILQLSAQDYLDRASRVEGSERVALLLDAVSAYLQQQNAQSAASLLESLDLTSADQNLLARYHLLLAATGAAQSRWDEALQSLQFPGTREQEPSRWHLVSGKVQRGLGNQRAAIGEFHRCALLEQPPFATDCIDLRWQTLLAIHRDLLPRQDVDPQLLAWTDLARIIRDSSGPIELQVAALDRWLRNNPALASQLPPEASALMVAELDIPRRIAVLLPLSGRLEEAGLAILDGVLAAHFELLESGYPAAELDIFDTASEPLDQLAVQLSGQPYDLVLGPLDPQRVQQLADRVAPEVPMLAFNRIEEPGEADHFGISLAVETEASQAAVDALADDMRRALVLVQDSAYGERAASAFTGSLQQSTDSSLAGLIRVNNPTSLTTSLEQAFHIDQSELRRQQLQSLLGKRLEFSPRRRQDIDFIFLASSAGLARQVGPTLAFVFAENVPVLATSQVYESQVGAEENRDLGRINFLAPNWSLQQLTPLDMQTGRTNELQRLEALGYDAFFLGRRLQYTRLSRPGYRGLLAQWHGTADGNFVRTMEWGQVNGEGVSRSDWNR